MFAYCGNNPICRADSCGYVWEWVLLGIVGVAVNLTTTFIAAKVTNQQYTWADAGVATLSGFCNAIPSVGPYVSGGSSGLYSGYTSYKNGASLGEAFICGSFSAFSTTCSIGNLAGLTGGPFEIAVTATADLVFGIGYNSLSAAVNKSVIDNNGCSVSNTPKCQQSNIINIINMQSIRIINGTTVSVKNKASFPTQVANRIYCQVDF